MTALTPDTNDNSGGVIAPAATPTGDPGVGKEDLDALIETDTSNTSGDGSDTNADDSRAEQIAESLEEKYGEALDAIVDLVEPTRKAANLHDNETALWYVISSFAIHGTMKLDLPEDILEKAQKVTVLIEEVASRLWGIVKAGLSGFVTNLDDVIFALVTLIWLFEKLGVPLLEPPFDHTDSRIAALEKEAGYTMVDEKEYKKSWKKLPTWSKVSAWIAKKFPKTPSTVLNGISRGGPWLMLAYALWKVRKPALAVASVVAHMIGEPRRPTPVGERGKFLGYLDGDPTVTAWMLDPEDPKSIRFYDKNDQEFKVWSSNPWDKIVDENGEPVQPLNSGGLVARAKDKARAYNYNYGGLVAY